MSKVWSQQEINLPEPEFPPDELVQRYLSSEDEEEGNLHREDLADKMLLKHYSLKLRQN